MDAGSQLRFWRTARTLKRMRPREKRKVGKARAPRPAVFFVTDPDRTPDPVAVAARLPAGTGVIFRGFGRPDAEATARALAKVARVRRLILLIGADPVLAIKVGAAGVHLPERDLGLLRRIRAHHPQWIITVAAHSPWALARAKTVGADAALYSAIFPSRSASAGAPLGPTRLGLMLGGSGVPVYALGGVNGATAARLIGTGAAGFAAVEAFED